jgi:hypothetical protein
MTVTPQQLLNAQATYTLNVSGMQDIAGNAQLTPLAVSFTTGDTADLIGSSTLTFSITSGTSDVVLSPQLGINLSERIDPTSIESRTLFLHEGDGVAINSTWSLSGDGLSIILQPDSPLDAGKNYYVYAGYNPNFKDLAGNSISGGHSLNFTTAMP